MLSIDDSLKDTLRQAVQAGRTVVIPQRELTLGKYTGIGYVIFDPLTGSGAYMIDGGFNGGRQSSCAGSTEPQVGIIDPVVIALFGFVGDPSKYQVVTNPVWRQLLLRLLVMPQVMAPLTMAVGVSVTLIVIAVIVRRIMQEAELESMVEESKCGCIFKREVYYGGNCKTCIYQCPGYGAPVTFPQTVGFACPTVGANGLVDTSQIQPPCRY